MKIFLTLVNLFTLCIDFTAVIFLTCISMCNLTAEEQGSYDHVVVNDQLEVAYEHLKGLLIKVSITKSFYLPHF